MPKVIFKFDIKKDAKNYYDTANSTPYWGHDFSKGLRPEVKKMLKSKKWNKVKEKLLNMLKKGYQNNEKFHNKKLKEIEKKWKTIEDKYFQKLAEITKQNIYTENFLCYFTTIGRCPYSKKENSFMVSVFNKLENSIITIAHEIMHLQFHYYYEEKLKEKISNKEFHNIKEALTVLLNLEFKEVLGGIDKGYPNHQKLRNFIIKEWKKEPDFDVLLEKCVDYIKK